MVYEGRKAFSTFLLYNRSPLGYTSRVKIRTFAHKGIKRLYTDDSARGLPSGVVDKLRKMLAFLQDMEDVDELRSIPVWKAHLLTGDRKGIWGLHVTKNWRLTFWIDTEENAFATSTMRITTRRKPCGC